MSKGQANLIQRIQALEEKTSRNEKVIKTAIKKMHKALKEKNMEEFDFDNLLEEIDSAETAEAAEKVITEAVAPKEDVVASPEAQVTPIEQVVALVDEANDIVEPLIENEITEPTEMDSSVYDASQTKIQELEAEVKELKEKIRGVKAVQATSVSDEVISKYEYSSEAKSFLKDNDEFEMEKRSITERQKARKEEAKESGVDVAATLKAQKEVIKELKETSEEAQIIEQMKQEIKNDGSLMATVAVMAG